MNAKLIKIVCLTVLMMGSALQAMDSYYASSLASQGAVAGKADLDSQLMEAVFQRDKQQVKRLIEGGADVNTTDLQGRPILGMTVYFGHYDVCKLLIDNGADINVKNAQCGIPALNMAAREGYKEICELLIAHGALVNMLDDHGSTALIAATASGDNFVKICELLLEKRAAVNIQEDMRGENALMQAAASGNDAVCKLLLAQGALIHQEDNTGWTALMRAASKGNIETCHLLIKEMMKFTIAETKSIVALIGSSKKRRSSYLNLIGRDGVSLILGDLCRQIKTPKRAKAHEEIMKIKSWDRDIQEESLQYLGTL